MNNLRIALAVLAGLLVAACYATGLEGWPTIPKLVPGLMFGAGITWSLLKTPERTTALPNLISVGILLVILNVWTIFEEPRATIVRTLVWTALFGGTYLASARIYQRQASLPEEHQAS